MKLCKIEGCDKPVHVAARQLCVSHYMTQVRMKNVPLLVNRPIRLCMVKDCDNKHYIGGVCHKHHERLRIHGSLELPKNLLEPALCSTGCGRLASSRGYCSSHYARWSKYGDAGPVEIRPRVLQGHVAYARARGVLREARGFAKEHTCIECPKTATRWTLTETATVYRDDYGQYNGLPYSDNPSDYEPRCTKHATAHNDEYGFGRGSV